MATTFRLKRKLFAGFGAAVGNMFGRSNFQNLKGVSQNISIKNGVVTKGNMVNAAGKEITGKYKAEQIAKGVGKAVGTTALVGTGIAAAGVAGTSALAKKSRRTIGWKKL